MNFIKHTFFAYFFLLLTFPNVILATPSEQQDNAQPWITVFVHGNYGSFLTTLSFDKVLKENYESTPYLKVQQWLRNHLQFHVNHFMPERGLRKIAINKKRKNSFASAIVKSYNDALYLVDHQQAENTTYYTFGWNGLLSQKARRQAAVEFYAALSDKVAHYKKKGLSPKIRIVCHSHGGNVSLNLAGVHALLNNISFRQKTTTASVLKMSQEITLDQLPQLDQNLCIDELILLATPIQVETEEFASSALFKKVYSFYSHNDIIQIVDFISTDGPISKRTIAPELLTPNITQVQFSVIDHTQTPTPSWLISFIKKCFFPSTTTQTSRPTSKKQALAVLLKSIAAGKEAYGMLPAVERIVQTITHFSQIPEEKDFDHQALNTELQAIQKNMLEHPHDPSHSEFVKTSVNYHQKTVDHLPMFVWTPIICRLLEKKSTQPMSNNAHVTLHDYNKTVKIILENQDDTAIQAEISEPLLQNLKKKYVSYLP